jgi:uncharacterized phage-associated protein
VEHESINDTCSKESRRKAKPPVLPGSLAPKQAKDVLIVVYAAKTVADWFLAYVAQADDDDGDITNLKLQKLLYYAQGHWLASHSGEPLFAERIKAWAHGPVIPQVYHDFKEYGRQVLPEPGDEFSWDQVDPEVDEFLARVWTRYGGYSASGLRALTHSETPWVEAWSSPEESPEISCETMRQFFEHHSLNV